ncbi:Hypothetical predicted protein [Cloeon dipterum]|uniref:Uncharacterized protein n=1 Tax=Cloeon dipterum TaxID=197152 RepID=A0A8S1DW48_9INSE|nr:Hypothetical predicted protein [Cloeon dipterum]
MSDLSYPPSPQKKYFLRYRSMPKYCYPMHESSSDNRKLRREEKDDVMRDWQSAQNDLRQWYIKFLDKLIGTYEDEKVVVRKSSSWANILNDIQNNSKLLSENSHEELLKFFG